MILLLGASGYIGQAFQDELIRRGLNFIPLSRAEVDYSRFEVLTDYLKQNRPEFLINAAGYAGKPTVNACEFARAETLAGNSLFPATVAHACAVIGIPWGHVSSGCIYSGAHVLEGGVSHVERDLMRGEVFSMWKDNRACLRGFNEEDEPNFTFQHPPCSFYSGSKALGENAIAGVGESYIWRLRMPFDERNSSRNYLSKIQHYPRLLEAANSISHRRDFVQACLDLWERRSPFGIYNVTNPGWIMTSDVVTLIEGLIPSRRSFHFFKNHAEFYSTATQTPRSNCIMNVTKLLSTGVKIRPVEEALDHALRNWKP